jgi:hypothetical protein
MYGCSCLPLIAGLGRERRIQFNASMAHADHRRACQVGRQNKIRSYPFKISGLGIWSLQAVGPFYISLWDR